MSLSSKGVSAWVDILGVDLIEQRQGGAPCWRNNSETPFSFNGKLRSLLRVRRRSRRRRTPKAFSRMTLLLYCAAHG